MNRAGIDEAVPLDGDDRDAESGGAIRFCPPPAALGTDGGGREIAYDETNGKTTAQNPNFVADYFASSRLHFIGSFRARYEMMMMKVAKRLNCSTARLLRDPSETAAGSSKKRKRERERIIVHVDMDCFFASVALRDNPELRGKPIAVCHSGNAGNDPSSGAKGGEISSCSYEARAYGVKAGMFFKKAKVLCPELLAVPYDFDAYERVSVDLYFLFFGIDERVIVEAKSVDEAYLDLTGVVDSQAMSPSDDSVDALVGKLRQDIFNLTGCRASAGIGPSKLLARLGTSKAKPNGQWQVQAEDAPAFLLGFNVHELPGIGWKTRQRFKEMGVKSCEDLRSLCLDRLTAEFGPVSGRTFFDYCRGIDGEDVKPLAPRKSIGAELSWGVRFGVSDDDKVEVFISGVAAEVARRCESAQAVPSKVVMKVYRKKPDSGPPGKYLGHGPCDLYHKSAPLNVLTTGDLSTLLTQSCLSLYAALKIPNEELRGLAIQCGDIIFPGLTQKNRSSGTGNIAAFFGISACAPRSAVDAASETSRPRPTELPRTTSTDEILPATHEGAVTPVPSDDAILAAVDGAQGDRDHAQVGSVTQATVLNRLDPEVLKALPFEMRNEEFMKQQMSLAAKFEACRSAGNDLNQATEQSHLCEHCAGGDDDDDDADDNDDDDEAASGGNDNIENDVEPNVSVIEQIHNLQKRRVLQSNNQQKQRNIRRQQTMTQMCPVAPSTVDVKAKEDSLSPCSDSEAPSQPPLSAEASQCAVDGIYGVRGVSKWRPGSVMYNLEIQNAIYDSRGRLFADEALVSYAPKLRAFIADTSENVRSAHAILLRTRCLAMVQMRQYTRVHTELTFIRHCVEEVGGDDWAEAFNALLGSVQTAMLLIQGRRLAIRPFRQGK